MHLILKFIFILSLLPGLAWAEFKLTQVKIKCSGSSDCANRVAKLKGLKRNYLAYENMVALLKLYMGDESVKFFTYKIVEAQDQKFILDGELILKQTINSLDMDEVADLISVPSMLPLRSGGFYDSLKEEKLIENLTNLVRSKGYPNAELFTEKKRTTSGYDLKIKVKKGKPRLIKSINIQSNSSFLNDAAVRKLFSLKNKPFDHSVLKEMLTDLRSNYVGYGYYPIDVKYEVKNLKSDNVEIQVEIKDQILYSFDVKGATYFDLATIKSTIVESMTSLKKVFNKESLTIFVKDLYTQKGYFDVKLDIEQKDYKDINSVPNTLFVIKVEEGTRYKIKELNFNGNNFFINQELSDLFYSSAPADIKDQFHDEEYYFNFTELLRTKYLENGFVNVVIDKPIVSIRRETKAIEIEYRIREVVRAIVSDIEITGVDEILANKIRKLMVNRQKKPFNPLVFEEDLKNIISMLRNEGHYYARFYSTNSEDLVAYNHDASSVQLKLNIDLGQKYKINNLIIIGNYKTKSKLIRRDSGFVRGSYLTEEMMRNAQTNLLELGLFSRVYIKPVKMGDEVDLFIDVEEKDFGTLELAPGFRTDLGYKMSAKLSYINLDGMNKQVTASTQVNRRVTKEGMDKRRKKESPHLLEYENNVTYSENKIFDSPFDYTATVSALRKRFYSFDADIESLNNTVSWNNSSWFQYSFRHQLEVISQYDSSLDREHGHFRIGSLTPGITLDFRDNRINPLKGAYFNLSCEFANPYFGSQDTKELEVNYYKLISRNRLYIPLGDVTFAISASFGAQKNLATEKREENGVETTSGYIPNIKVFRLNGMDLVRGFEDNEINRLVNGKDISEVKVDDTAYMANIKLEPRVFISDSMMLGVFYDAGRVFVGEYDFSQLRSSAGISFKYLTPVGSLDFDYGIKLLRKRDEDGTLESPGRLHVSIGFF